MVEGRKDVKRKLVPYIHLMLTHQQLDVGVEAVLLLILQDNKDVLNRTQEADVQVAPCAHVRHPQAFETSNRLRGSTTPAFGGGGGWS